MSWRWIALAAGLLGIASFAALWPTTPAGWSAEQQALLASLSLSSLPPLPADPSNSVADNTAAASFGQQLFNDSRLSLDGTVACASCHQSERNFTDGLPLARALGTSRRNTPSITGTAYSPWLYWDGRKDSQWSQALAPLEDPNEQGSSRLALVRLLYQDKHYRRQYQALFGELPELGLAEHFPVHATPLGNRPEWQAAWAALPGHQRQLINTVFANLGKLIAAWERGLQHRPTRFDRFVDALLDEDAQADQWLSEQEKNGLRLFIGKARCLECHNGPLFTNNEFHNTGLLPLPGEVPDQGRSAVLQSLRDDPFNCLGEYSDAEPADCQELRFMRTGPELLGAMRTPSLRNLAGTAPYMHKGQLPDLAAVLKHYNAAMPALIGHNEAEPLGLSSKELRDLEAFLGSLQAIE